MRKSVFISLLIFISFSCNSDDHYWSKGYINETYKPTTNHGGYFDIETKYYINDIDSIDVVQGGRIEEIRVSNARIELFGDFKKGYKLEDFVFDVANVGSYKPAAKSISRNSEIIIFDTKDDKQFFDILNRAALRLGSMDDMFVTVSGYLYDENNAVVPNINITANLKITFDVRVKD